MIIATKKRRFRPSFRSSDLGAMNAWLAARVGVLAICAILLSGPPACAQEHLRLRPQPRTEVSAVALSKDGRLVLTLVKRIWLVYGNVATGKQIRSFMSHLCNDQCGRILPRLQRCADRLGHSLCWYPTSPKSMRARLTLGFNRRAHVLAAKVRGFRGFRHEA